MGQQSSVNFFKTPLKDYENMKSDEKEFIDSILKDALKSNRFLGEISPVNDSLWFFKWIDIINLNTHIKGNNLIQILKLVYGVDEKVILEQSAFTCYSSYEWIVNQLEEIAKIQENDLYRELTPKEKAAGFEKLEEFDYAVTLDYLTGGDMTKDEEFLQLPFWKIHRKQRMNKINAEIQTKLNKA